MSREHGVDEPKLRALNEHAVSSLFTSSEKAALAYADAMTVATSVSDEVFAKAMACFGEDAVIELTAAIAWEICASKFNRALEIEAQGICLITTTEG